MPKTIFHSDIICIVSPEYIKRGISIERPGQLISIILRKSRISIKHDKYVFKNWMIFLTRKARISITYNRNVLNRTVFFGIIQKIFETENIYSHFA